MAWMVCNDWEIFFLQRSSPGTLGPVSAKGSRVPNPEGHLGRHGGGALRGGRRGCKALHAPEAEALERHLFDRSASKESEEWAVQERYRTLLADASLLFISAIWGLGFAAMKGALESFPPFWLLTIRFAAAALLIALIFWRRMRRIAWEDLRGGMIIGVFLFLGFATQTVGLLYTTASKQAFLTAVYVVLVPFFAWGLKRVFPGMRPFGASALCLLGMAFLTLDLKGDFVINYGDVLTLICAIFFAGHLLAIERFASHRDPVLLAFGQIATTAVLSLVLAVPLEAFPTQISSTGFWSMVYCILFPTVVAFVIQNMAQRYTPSTHVSIVLSLESLFGALAGIFLLGEHLSDRMVLGCACIFAAVILTEVDPAPLLRRMFRKTDATA